MCVLIHTHEEKKTKSNKQATHLINSPSFGYGIHRHVLCMWQQSNNASRNKWIVLYIITILDPISIKIKQLQQTEIVAIERNTRFFRLLFLLHWIRCRLLTTESKNETEHRRKKNHFNQKLCCRCGKIVFFFVFFELCSFHWISINSL